MRILLFLVFLGYGCESGELCDIQPYEYEVLPLYIDTHCHEEHVAAIERAVDTLNGVSSGELCQPILAIGESVDVDHNKWKAPPGTITCYYEEPPWIDDHPEINGKVGWGTLYKSARIFIWKIPRHHINYHHAIILHELGHYIGLGHVPDRDSAMHKSISASHRQFTSVDIDEFCLVYDC